MNGKMYAYFVDNPSPMCLTNSKSKEILAYNKSFLKKECDFMPFVTNWQNDYSESAISLVEINNRKIQFIESDLEDKLSLIQMVEFSAPNYQKNCKNSDSLTKNDFYIEAAASQINSKTVKHEDKFIKIAKIAPIGVVFTDQDFNILWNNEKSLSLFGRNRLFKVNFLDAIYIQHIPEFWSKIKECKHKETPVKFNFTIKNLITSQELHIKCSAFAVENDPEYKNEYIFLLEDNTENTNFSEEITERNIELNHTNHELDKFLYSVSHNIRGPVASLEGLLEVIKISDVDAVNKLQHHLRLNLRLLNAFVNDISNVATNIHTHIKRDEFKLYPVVEELLLFMDNIYEVNAIKEIEIPFDYTLKSDADRLSIVLKSIFKNSFQYRDSRKKQLKINITVSKNEDFYLMTIIDNGIGIAEEVKPKIFDMFYRGTELSTGNGMGLHNSREILKKIGGTMNIESMDRQWTKVKIYLPVKV